MSRIILYVQNVQLLTDFYRDNFGFPVVEDIPDEWTVFRVGACELALHRAGQAYRRADASPNVADATNAKLVLTIDGDLAELRQTLLANGVAMREIKSFPPLTGLLCDGTDPEGNVFQLAHA